MGLCLAVKSAAKEIRLLTTYHLFTIRFHSTLKSTLRLPVYYAGKKQIVVHRLKTVSTEEQRHISGEVLAKSCHLTMSPSQTQNAEPSQQACSTVS